MDFGVDALVADPSLLERAIEIRDSVEGVDEGGCGDEGLGARRHGEVGGVAEVGLGGAARRVVVVVGGGDLDEGRVFGDDGRAGAAGCF